MFMHVHGSTVRSSTWISGRRDRILWLLECAVTAPSQAQYRHHVGGGAQDSPVSSSLFLREDNHHQTGILVRWTRLVANSIFWFLCLAEVKYPKHPGTRP